MRQLKKHLLIVVTRTAGPLQQTSDYHILCRTPAAEAQLTLHRDRVTCNICNHLAKKYGDDCVIPRGNAFNIIPPDLLVMMHGDVSPFMARLNNVKSVLRQSALSEAVSRDIASRMPQGVIVTGTLTETPDYSVGPTEWIHDPMPVYKWRK